MQIITPAFRAPGASYYFIADHSGSIIAVVYPDGTRFLRAGESD